MSGIQTNKIITLEEKKKKFIQKLDVLSEKELNYLLNFIEGLSNKKQSDKHVNNETFNKLLERDLQEYKEVWKKLA